MCVCRSGVVFTCVAELETDVSAEMGNAISGGHMAETVVCVCACVCVCVCVLPPILTR